MEQNLVNAELTISDAAEINTALESIHSKMPFLISLSAQDRVSILKLGDGMRPVVEISANVITEHPEIMPGTFNCEDFKKDFNLMKALEPLSQKLQLLKQAVDDTILAAGSDSLSQALEVYSEVKNHKDKIPGLNAIYNEMKAYFSRKRNKNSDQQQTPPAM